MFDYLGDAATVVLHGDLEPAFQHFWQDTRDRYRLLQGDPERPVLPPEALFLSADQFYTQCKAHPQLAIRPGVNDVVDNAHFQPHTDLSVVRGAEDPLSRLQAHIRNTPHRVLLLAESAGRRESLLDFLRATHCDTLYLVGDIIDGWQLRRHWHWPQAHNDVVQKLLRKVRKGTRVVFVPGNHDEFARHFLGHHFGGIWIRAT